MTTIQLPQTEGEFTPAEARRWMAAQTQEPNVAGTDQDLDARVIKFVQNNIISWTMRMRGLHRRWRGTYKMLAGNTLEQGGPEDLHVPEIYKAIETLVPRVEEAILEKEPWFRVVPRRKVYRREAETLAAFIDWQFDQAQVRTLIQPAIRDMLVAQCATFYVYWENQIEKRSSRTPNREFVDGRIKKSVTIGKREDKVAYSGPVVKLVDPFDFIIDTKSTNPQNAIYVGHRAFLSLDEIQRHGKALGWKNLDKLYGDGKQTSGFNVYQDYYKWARDPTARYSTDPNNRYDIGQTPNRIEVVFLHSKFDWTGENKEWTETRMVVAGGSTVLELMENPNDGQFRPYATCRASNNGHEFYGTGIFDNAIRINQHLDLMHQILVRGARLMGCPIGFAEEDSADLPDSIYKLTPGKIIKGAGPIRFTQVPDGMLRAGPLMVQLLQKNIEETVGSFRIDMGQQVGNTATEATLSLQEGNRRTRGVVRAVGDGLEQLLNIFHKYDLQYSTSDVEFPVLGKRAIDMRRTHENISPADLMEDVKFDLVGLHSLRTNGLKATGWMSAINALQPFIVANPQAVDQVGIMHDVVAELVGPDEADQRVKVPTPIDQLYAPEDENEGLLDGELLEVDPDDDDQHHLDIHKPLYTRALHEKGMHIDVRRAITQHYLNHVDQRNHKIATKNAVEARAPQPIQLPPEVGGQQGQQGGASPQAGGFSDPMQALADQPGGQTPGETPGPPDQQKFGKTGRGNRPTSQTNNQLGMPIA